jgi:hypothetical protein
VIGVLRPALATPELRRVCLAFAGFNCAEWAVWIAMLVYAYHRGGATTAGLVAVVQLVPAGLVAPAAAGLADRYRPARLLSGGYVAQAGAMGATALSLLAGGPPFLSYAFAAAAASAVTLTRPTQAALLPGLVRAPEELTALNAVGGWIEGSSILVAPALTGALLGVSSPGVVFAVMAGVAAAAAAVVAPVAGPPPQRTGGGASAARVLARAPAARALVGLLGAQYVVIGALDVLFVVLAIAVLRLGDGGAGYLNAAFGAGGAVGIVATAGLVGRRRLAPALVAGAAAWSAAFVAVGGRPQVLAVLPLLALAGVGRSVFDVAGRTLLQRTAPTEALGAVFGVLEGLSMAGLAVGSVLAPALVSVVGARWAVAGAAAVLPAALVLASRPLLRADAAADVPVVEIALLRALPLFAPLPPPELEALARGLEPVAARAGEAVVVQGERGDRFYVVADGELEVEIDGARVGVLARGDCFGEIALLRHVPRTATVRALAPSRLHALGRTPFLRAVTGSAPVAAAAEELVHERLAAARIAP